MAMSFQDFGCSLLVGLLAAGCPQVATAQSEPPPAAFAVPVFLNHPTVIDTAHLRSGDTTVALSGIQGWGGDAVGSLQSFITANGDRVTCRPHEGGTFTCMMPTGLDVAATALANGAAETLADAPADYRQQQRAAQEGQLGIWAGQTPAPLILQHPTVQTTATLSADGRSVTLDGVSGFAAPFYTLQLQTYIATHGDRVSCQQRGNTGRYVCLLPDKADLAAVALTSGLARASAEASAEYRADQARAEADRSGIWFEPPIQGGVAQPVLNAVPNCCVYAQGDLAEGITYADGVPTALVGGEPVFFVYDGLLGFGFFDVERRFHRAPEPFLSHLNRFHPQGAGLRGLGSAVSAPAAGAFRAPVVFSPGGTRAALAAGMVGSSGGRGYPSPFAVRGAQSATPGFQQGIPFGGRVAAGPRFTPYQRSFGLVAGPRPGFAGAGGFHPGVVAPFHAAPAFIGRR